MAKIESMIGFVTEWKYGSDEPNPKWAMKVSEPHSKKDGEKWVKVGSTNYTIKAAYGVDIDFTKFGKNDRVEVKGTQVSESWESGDKRGKNLVIKATSVELLTRGEREARQVGTFDRTPDGWVEVDSELPF